MPVRPPAWAYKIKDELADIWDDVRRPAGRLLRSLAYCCREPEPKAAVDPFETAAERQLAEVLAPYSLSEFTTAVKALAAAGYSDFDSLKFISDETLLQTGHISRPDQLRILLAGWLRSVQLDRLGPDLVGNGGVVSLAELAKMGDQDLVRSGVKLLGHRRVLLRELREAVQNSPALFVSPEDVSAGQQSAAHVASQAARLRAAAEREAAAARQEEWRERATSQGSMISGSRDARGQDLELKLGTHWLQIQPWRSVTQACLLGEGELHMPPAREAKQLALRNADGRVAMRLEVR